MPRNKPQILCTASIGQAIADKVAAHGIALDIVPFISIKNFSDKSLEAEIELLYKKTATIVFTSTNAVATISAYKDDIVPDWDIFCMGQATKRSVIESFGVEKIKGTADNASALAETIINKGDIKEIVFFCGDIHRDELPAKLKKAGISVKEVVVYKTVTEPQKIVKKYDAVLFFSPSAVNSFFEANKADEKTVFFAIGATTAAALSDRTSNTVVVGNRPGKEELVELAIGYFENKEINA